MSRFRAALAASMFSLLTITLPARAAEPRDASVRLTIREAAAAALRANPSVRAATEGIAAARAEVDQAGRWPNPEAEAEWADDLAFTGEGERSGSIGFTQPIPIGGRVGRARAVARAEVAISEADSAEVALELIRDTQAAAVSILALGQAIAAREEAIAATRELVRISAQRLREAEVSEVDVNLLEVELSSLEQERELLRLDRVAAEIALNRLLSQPLATKVEIVGELEDSLLAGADASQLSERAMLRRPDLQRLRHAAERARAQARLARAEAWDDWRLGAAYQREVGTIDDEGLTLRDSDDLLAFSVRIPLPLWNRNRGAVAAALARERAAAARLSAAEEAVRAAIATAAQRALRLRDLAESYQAAVIPRARRNVELLSRGYQQGLAPVADVVQGQRQLAEVSARLAETLAALRNAEIELETAAAASPLLTAPAEDQEKRS
jgi:cobalt-zinc-cadmium efflux system outer membrane protein